MNADGAAMRAGRGAFGPLSDFDILDSGLESSYDDIAVLAAQICGTPIAYVSFIDGNRQWFKSKVGFDMAENTLDKSFCLHTLRQSSMLVIPDLRLDARTAGNRLVTEAPQLRFYAGAILQTADDHRLGTVCVMDVNPHPQGLSQAQEAALQALARQVMELLQLRQLLRERDVMTRELNHRIKNTLTIVRSIASQSFTAITDAEARKTFDSRLHALEQAHTILVKRDWTSGDLRSIAVATLAPHATVGQVSIQGADFELNPVAAVSLSLLLHELATNALKYGALSMPQGRVDIAWHRIGSGAETDLVLTWTESGGPTVRPPTSKGFGTRLISSGLAGTRQADLVFKPTGLQATFKAPLAALVVN
jgi:two-component sensor histidine kinase